MRKGYHRFRTKAGLLVLLLSVVSTGAPARQRIDDSVAFLKQTEALRTKDHPRFVQQLENLHLHLPELAPAQRWHLEYLDAWEAMFEGNYAASQKQFRDIIERSGDATLQAKSSALLLGSYGITRQYERAFALANDLTEQLPKIRDLEARSQVIANLSQVFNLAGQSDLALKYARMLVDTNPPGESLCYPLSQEVFALSNAKKIHSDSKELSKAIDTCVEAGQPVITNALWLVKGEHLLREGKPAADLKLLGEISPSISLNEFQPHIISSLAQEAQAHERLGQDDRAKTAALAAIGKSENPDVNEWLRDAYQVLYQVARRQGENAAALKYYEAYVAQDRGYLNDISARSLAFQLAKQKLLAKKLENEELSKQNSILKLQQALDAKAVETSRLYISLLIAVLVFIAAWLIRLKRSQLRFKRMSLHDGLTGIYNHQHFVAKSEKVLQALARRQGHACLIFIDLDHFKQVNDTYGHAMGDAVLKLTVTICRMHLRPGDIFGRLGGEEFGILLPDCQRARGMEAANQLLVSIGGTPMEKDGMLVSVSASVGLASTDNSGYDLQRLCKDADDALYRAKRGGRNQVVAEAEDPGTVGA